MEEVKMKEVKMKNNEFIENNDLLKNDDNFSESSSQFFTQFNDKMDDTFFKEIDDVEQKISELRFDKVPDGTYQAIVNSIEVRKSQKGNLMVATVFKILGGQYDKCAIRTYNVIKYSTIDSINEYLGKLESGREIKYEDSKQYTELVNNIFFEIKDTKVYTVEQTTSSSGFSNAEIKGVQTIEEEELPFMDEI